MDPRYTTVKSVAVRLANKVQFQSKEEPQEGELPDSLLLQLISDAETWVEQELRNRYAIPLRSIRTGQYSDLPDHTQRAIRMVVDKKSVLYVLTTDFGSGTPINPEGLTKKLEEDLDHEITRLLGQDKEAGSDKISRFRFSPPLEDLLLSPMNKTDNGFRGQAFVGGSDQCRNTAQYAADQVNDPSKMPLVTFGPRLGR